MKQLEQHVGYGGNCAALWHFYLDLDFVQAFGQALSCLQRGKTGL